MGTYSGHHTNHRPVRALFSGNVQDKPQLHFDLVGDPASQLLMPVVHQLFLVILLHYDAVVLMIQVILKHISVNHLLSDKLPAGTGTCQPQMDSRLKVNSQIRLAAA